MKDKLEELIEEIGKEIKEGAFPSSHLSNDKVISDDNSIDICEKYIRKAYNLGRLEERKIYHEEIQEKLKSVPMDKKTKKLLKNL